MPEKNKINIAWLSGGYHRRKSRLNEIRKRFEGVEQADISSDFSFDYLLNKLQSGGCFEPKRLVIVHGVPEFKGSNKKKYIDKLIERLKFLDKDCFVVFNGLDASKEKSLYEFSKKHGKVYEYEVKLDRRSAPSYIEGRLRDLGMSFESGVPELIIEMGGIDPSMNSINADLLEMSILKLVLYVTPETEIQKTHVEDVIQGMGNFVIWDLMKHMDNRDHDKCLSMLNQSHLLSNNVSAAVTQIMTTLIWQYRLILYLRECLHSGQSAKQSIDTVLKTPKLSKKGVGLNASMNIDPYKTGDKQGQPQPIWNYHTVNVAMNGMYGGPAAIDSWSRKDIIKLVNVIERVLVLLREAGDNESYLLADMVFMTACDKLPNSQVMKIIESVHRSRDF